MSDTPATDETDIVRWLMDTLAYYHCRSVNPKADDRIAGYHTFSADQRRYLQELEREAAEEVSRMWAAHDQALREQIALKLEERADVLAIAINPYLNDFMLAHLEDQIQTLREAAKVARGEA